MVIALRSDFGAHKVRLAARAFQHMTESIWDSQIS